MAKGDIRDKCRTSMSGLKVTETSEWGLETAARRYGELKTPPNMTAKDQTRPQDPMDRQGPGYRNDVANDWRRGANGTAENKPGYVPGYRPGRK